MQKVKKWLVYGFGAVVIILGILQLAGVVDLRGDDDLFRHGNLLENALRINISTQADHDKFKADGGLTKTDTWHGYRVTDYDIQYSEQTGKVSGFEVSLRREFVHHMGFATTIVTVNDLEKLLKPLCSPGGEAWSSMQVDGSDLYAVSLKSHPDLKYSCGILDNPQKQLITVLISLRKEATPESESVAPATRQAPVNVVQPKQISLRVCKDANGADQIFQKQVGAAIHGEPVKYLDQVYGCQKVMVMSNDQSSVSQVAGIGDHQFQMDHPVAFEISIVDSSCEKQCTDKAFGWVSSYDLPLDLWPTGNEFVKARANRASLDGVISGMAASNEVSRTIGSRKNISPEQRQDLYNHARDAYNNGVITLRNYGM